MSAQESYTVSATYEVQGGIAWGTVSENALDNCKLVFTQTVENEANGIHKVRFSFDGVHYYLLYDINEVLLYQWAPEGWTGEYLLDFSQVSATSVTIDMISEDSTYSGGLVFQYPLKERYLVLTPNASITLTETVNLDMTVTDVQKLTAGEYISVAPENWLPAYADGKISLNTGELPPGSYRLVLDLKWNQISVMEQYIYFFVNLK